MSLAKHLHDEFVGGEWSHEEIESAVKRVVEGDTPHSRCSVGTRGSVHHNEWSEPVGTAESSVEAACRRRLEANPVLGDLDTSCRPETAQERFARLCQEVAEILNA